MNGEKSEEEKVRTGVAQCSVLGPLLYLMYVHSLKCAELEAKYFKFADDTVLVYSGESEIQLEETVNRDLKLYFDWLCYNKLSLNVQKTVFMVIRHKGGPPCNPQIKINDSNIKRVTEYKYLGLTIADNLSWDKHIESVTNKIVPMVGSISRCAHQLNEKSRQLLYNGFIETHLRYLMPCWGNTSVGQLNRLQRLQNKAIKVLFGMNYYIASVEIYKKVPFLKIDELKILEQTKLIHDIQSNNLKTNIKLQQNSQYHTYHTRTNNALRNAYVRTKTGQDSPIYRSVQAYNNIPQEVFQGSSKSVYLNLNKYIRENRK